MTEDLTLAISIGITAVIEGLYRLHQVQRGAGHLLPLAGVIAKLNEYQLGAVVPRAFDEFTDSGWQLILLKPTVDKFGRIAFRGKRFEPSLLRFLKALHHALRPCRVALIGADQLPGYGGYVDSIVVKPLECFLHRALDALFEHLPGAVQPYLPTHGATLNRIEKLVQWMSAWREERVVADGHGHSQR